MALRTGMREWTRNYSLTVNYTRHICCSCGSFRQYHALTNEKDSSLQLLSNFSTTRTSCLNHRLYTYLGPNFLMPQHGLGQPNFKHLRDFSILTNPDQLEIETQLLRHRYGEGSARKFHGTRLNYDKSKVEDSLKAKLKVQATDLKVATESPLRAPSAKVVDTSKTAVAEEPKKSLWTRFVAELKHYYHGFRLLVLDMRIASKTLWKILRGKAVSRRERNQFKRALSDIFRLAPFSIFIIIPFAELALPIVVKIFPGLLPSTFEDKTTRETRLRKELAVKLQMAKFMQDTVEDIAMRSKKSSQDNKATEDFANFFQKIRTTDEDPTNEEILKHAKLFEDELTLDSMTRPQLVALCRLIQVPAVGSNNLLRFLLQMKLNRLHVDDTMIQREGIDNMTVQELQTACQARGMRALGMSEQRLKQQLEQWIDLHLNHDVPSSLLLLSRVLFMPENVPVEKLVKEAISALPEKVADEAEVRAAEINCERIDNTKRYKITKQEQLEIAKEEAEEKLKEKEKKLAQKQKKKEEAEAPEAEKLTETVETTAQPADLKDTIVLENISTTDPIELHEREAMMDISMAEERRDEGPVLKDKAPILKEEITKEEIDTLDRVIGTIAKEDSLNKAKSQLEDLREDLVEYQQDVLSLDRNLSSEEDEIVMKEKKASTRLQKTIARFIGNMDKIVTELEKQRKDTTTNDDELGDEVVSVSVEELKHSLRSLGSIPEDKLSAIADLLDANKDGNIYLEEALQAIGALDSEDVSVSADQLRQLLTLVQKTKKEGSENDESTDEVSIDSLQKEH